MNKKSLSYIVIVCLMVIVFIVPPAHSNDIEVTNEILLAQLMRSMNETFAIVNGGFGILEYLESEMRWDTKAIYLSTVWDAQIVSMYNVMHSIMSLYWSPEKKISKKESQAVWDCMVEWRLNIYDTFNWSMCETCIKDKLNY